MKFKCILFLVTGFIYIFAQTPSLTYADGFSWPIDCIPGVNCDGQKTRIGFPDIEGTGIAYSCGPAGYTGHLGTDILVSSVEQDVKVLAAADGVVRWLEDGMYDRCPNSSRWECDEQRKSFLHIEEGVKASLGFNAGNYVVLEHNEGNIRYLTLYAHIKNASLRVVPGQRITRGDILATVGSSGNSLTPHLHFGVFRLEGTSYRPVDPWKGECNNTSQGLWANNPPFLINKTSALPPPLPVSIHLVKAQQVSGERSQNLKY